MTDRKPVFYLWMAHNEDVVYSYIVDDFPYRLEGFSEWALIAKSDNLLDDDFIDATAIVINEAKAASKKHYFMGDCRGSKKERDAFRKTTGEKVKRFLFNERACS